MVEDILLPLMTTEKGQRIGLAITTLLGIFVFVTLIQTVMTWRHDILLTQRTPVMHTMPAVDTDSQWIAQLPQQHLFGQSEDVDFLPITSLQLHLTGIVKSSQDNLSRALIAEGSQSGKVYTVGDVLVSGIRIYAIHEDGVVLEHAGQLEKLPLTRASLAFKNQPQPLWNQELVS